MRARSRFLTDEKGASAAEFALVLIPFIALVLGIIGVSTMIYANETLQYATEDAARCAAVKTSTCFDQTSVSNYALGRYTGPALSPTFAYDPAASCGHSVTGSATMALDTGLVNISVPLQAHACFP
jgi:Flp pilus assembly protein TadG